MGFLSWIKNFLGGTALSRAFVSAVASRYTLPRKDTEALLKAYEDSPWLRATTGRTARDVGTTTWRVYQPIIKIGDTEMASRPTRQQAQVFNKGKGIMTSGQRNKLLDQALENNEVKELTSHPILDLLHNPNPVHSQMQVLMVTAAGLNSAGEYYWWTPRGKSTGMPKEIWPIPPHWVQRVPNDENPTYEVRHHKFNKVIPAEDMVRFRDPSPHNPYERGTGVGGAVGGEVDIDRLARDHILSFFKNGGMPDVLIGVDGATEEALKEAKRKFMESYLEAGSAHGVHFYSGDIDVKTLQPTFKEQQMIEVKQSSRDSIMQVQGHPPEIHGVLENANRSTIDASLYLYSIGVLLPFLQLIAQTIQHQLMPRFGEVTVVFSFDSPVPEDTEVQIEILRIAPTAFKVDEIRKLAGFPPLPDGEGDELFVPVTYSSATGETEGDSRGGSQSESGRTGSDDDGEKSTFQEQVARSLNVPASTH